MAEAEDTESARHQPCAVTAVGPARAASTRCTHSLVATTPASSLKVTSSILSGCSADHYARTAPGSRSGAAPRTRYLPCSGPALLQQTIPFAEAAPGPTRSLVAVTSTSHPGGHQFDPGRVQRGSLCADVDAAATGSSDTSTLHLLCAVRADAPICKMQIRCTRGLVAMASA